MANSYNDKPISESQIYFPHSSLQSSLIVSNLPYQSPLIPQFSMMTPDVIPIHQDSHEIHHFPNQNSIPSSSESTAADSRSSKNQIENSSVNSNGNTWWLQQHPKGRLEIFHISGSINKSKYTKSSQLEPLYRFVISWEPIDLSRSPQIENQNLSSKFQDSMASSQSSMNKPQEKPYQYTKFQVEQWDEVFEEEEESSTRATSDSTTEQQAATYVQSIKDHMLHDNDDINADSEDIEGWIEGKRHKIVSRSSNSQPQHSSHFISKKEVQHVAGKFSWSIDSNSGALLTVLAGKPDLKFLASFVLAMQVLKPNMRKEDLLKRFAFVSQDAASQIAGELWLALIGIWSPFGKVRLKEIKKQTWHAVPFFAGLSKPIPDPLQSIQLQNRFSPSDAAGTTTVYKKQKKKGLKRFVPTTVIPTKLPSFPLTVHPPSIILTKSKKNIPKGNQDGAEREKEKVALDPSAEAIAVPQDDRSYTPQDATSLRKPIEHSGLAAGVWFKHALAKGCQFNDAARALHHAFLSKHPSKYEHKQDCCDRELIYCKCSCNADVQPGTSSTHVALPSTPTARPSANASQLTSFQADTSIGDSIYHYVHLPPDVHRNTASHAGLAGFPALPTIHREYLGIGDAVLSFRARKTQISAAKQAETAVATHAELLIPQGDSTKHKLQEKHPKKHQQKEKHTQGHKDKIEGQQEESTTHSGLLISNLSGSPSSSSNVVSEEITISPAFGGSMDEQKRYHELTDLYSFEMAKVGSTPTPHPTTVQSCLFTGKEQAIPVRVSGVGAARYVIMIRPLPDAAPSTKEQSQKLHSAKATTSMDEPKLIQEAPMDELNKVPHDSGVKISTPSKSITPTPSKSITPTSEVKTAALTPSSSASKGAIPPQSKDTPTPPPPTPSPTVPPTFILEDILEDVSNFDSNLHPIASYDDGDGQQSIRQLKAKASQLLDHADLSVYQAFQNHMIEEGIEVEVATMEKYEEEEEGGQEKAQITPPYEAFLPTFAPQFSHFNDTPSNIHRYDDTSPKMKPQSTMERFCERFQDKCQQIAWNFEELTQDEATSIYGTGGIVVTFHNESTDEGDPLQQHQQLVAREAALDTVVPSFERVLKSIPFHGLRSRGQSISSNQSIATIPESQNDHQTGSERSLDHAPITSSIDPHILESQTNPFDYIKRKLEKHDVSILPCTQSHCPPSTSSSISQSITNALLFDSVGNIHDQQQHHDDRDSTQLRHDHAASVHTPCGNLYQPPPPVPFLYEDVASQRYSTDSRTISGPLLPPNPNLTYSKLYPPAVQTQPPASSVAPTSSVAPASSTGIGTSAFSAIAGAKQIKHKESQIGSSNNSNKKNLLAVFPDPVASVAGSILSKASSTIRPTTNSVGMSKSQAERIINRTMTEEQRQTVSVREEFNKKMVAFCASEMEEEEVEYGIGAASEEQDEEGQAPVDSRLTKSDILPSSSTPLDSKSSHETLHRSSSVQSSFKAWKHKPHGKDQEDVWKRRQAHVVASAEQMYTLNPLFISIDGITDQVHFTTMSSPFKPSSKDVSGIDSAGDPLSSHSPTTGSSPEYPRPFFVSVKRSQQSSITLDVRSKFCQKSSMTRSWILWPDSPFSSKPTNEPFKMKQQEDYTIDSSQQQQQQQQQHTNPDMNGFVQRIPDSFISNINNIDINDRDKEADQVRDQSRASPVQMGSIGNSFGTGISGRAKQDDQAAVGSNLDSSIDSSTKLIPEGDQNKPAAVSSDPETSTPSQYPLKPSTDSLSLALSTASSQMKRSANTATPSSSESEQSLLVEKIPVFVHCEFTHANSFFGSFPDSYPPVQHPQYRGGELQEPQAGTDQQGNAASTATSPSPSSTPICTILAPPTISNNSSHYISTQSDSSYSKRRDGKSKSKKKGAASRTTTASSLTQNADPHHKGMVSSFNLRQPQVYLSLDGGLLTTSTSMNLHISRLMGSPFKRVIPSSFSMPQSQMKEDEMSRPAANEQEKRKESSKQLPALSPPQPPPPPQTEPQKRPTPTRPLYPSVEMSVMLSRSVRGFFEDFLKLEKQTNLEFDDLFSMDASMKQRLEMAFNYLDLCQDGSLDEGEIGLVLARIRKSPLSAEALSQALLTLDPSGNGRIEISEFISYVYKNRRNRDSLLPIYELEKMTCAAFPCLVFVGKPTYSSVPTKDDKDELNHGRWMSCWLEFNPFKKLFSIFACSSDFNPYDPTSKNQNALFIDIPFGELDIWEQMADPEDSNEIMKRMFALQRKKSEDALPPALSQSQTLMEGVKMPSAKKFQIEREQILQAESTLGPAKSIMRESAAAEHGEQEEVKWNEINPPTTHMKNDNSFGSNRERGSSITGTPASTSLYFGVLSFTSPLSETTSSLIERTKDNISDHPIVEENDGEVDLSEQRKAIWFSVCHLPSSLPASQTTIFNPKIDFSTFVWPQNLFRSSASAATAGGLEEHEREDAAIGRISHSRRTFEHDPTLSHSQTHHPINGQAEELKCSQVWKFAFARSDFLLVFSLLAKCKLGSSTILKSMKESEGSILKRITSTGSGGQGSQNGRLKSQFISSLVHDTLVEIALPSLASIPL